jgi:transcriptional antiterminator RfaH
MTPISAPRWYAVHTQAHAERRAIEHLSRQGFRTYLPRYLRRRRHARRVETVAAPLFPRYLFVTVDLATQRWRSIQSTVGVSRLVCNGDDPSPVPDSVVTALRAREDDRGFIQFDERRRFAQGDRIQVLDGAFCDCFGLFERMTDDERVAVLLDLLGRKVRVVMDFDCVAAA